MKPVFDMYDTRYDDMEECVWAREQLNGLQHVSHFEWQMMMLVYIDCMSMEAADQGVTFFHWPSDFQPYSWSWLL